VADKIGLSTFTDEQAKAVTAVANFGATTVIEVSDLARYMGRIVGTVPEDAVGLVIGDPLHFVRAAIAAKYDEWITAIHSRRGVKNTQPVSPSVAIPLLRAAYDESRSDLQALWAALIAAAMDPARSGRVRLSFIETLKRFDPLDALVLKARYDNSGGLSPSAVEYLAASLRQPQHEITLSVENLEVLKCAVIQPHPTTGYPSGNFYLTNHGRALVQACTD
jgi:hypothetical protein